MGSEPPWDEEIANSYGRGCDPIANGSDALPLDQITADFDSSQQRLVGELEQATADDLQQPYKDGPVGDRVTFLCWHESTHTGQIEYLRQLAGR